MRRALHFLAVLLVVLSIPLAFGVLNSALRTDRADCLAGDARACSRVIDAGGMQGHDLAKAFFIRGLQAIADFETTLEVERCDCNERPPRGEGKPDVHADDIRAAISILRLNGDARL